MAAGTLNTRGATVEAPGLLTIAKAPSNDFEIGKPKRNEGSGSARLPVTVPGPGKLLLRGSDLKRAARETEEAGKVRLRVKPDGSTRSELEDSGSARVKASVTYTPAGGNPRTKAKGLKLVDTS